LQRYYYEQRLHRRALAGEAQHARVSGRGVFMVELLAELEQRSVAVRAEEVGGSTGEVGMGSDIPELHIAANN